MRRRRAPLPNLFLAFALLAIALRALVPAGYMVAPRGSDGALAIALCSEHGGSLVVDLRTGQIVDEGALRQSGSNDRDEQAAKKATAPCVFAAAAPLAPPEFGPGVPVRTHVVAKAETPRAHLAPGRGLAAPPPWATGPPILV